MVTYLWIALGSALGGVARHWCSGVVARVIGEAFPWGTIAVNVIGCLAIGFLATLISPDSRFVVAPDARSFLMIGVLGGYTTFSSFSLQTLNLVRDGEWIWAGANILFSVALCLIAVWAGHIGATVLNR